MIDLRTLSRPLLASSFVLGGYQVLRHPERVVSAAEQVGVPIAEKLGLTTDPTTLVKVNAGVQLGAGVLLAFGILPRAASLVLAASLVPTTAAGHRFWETKDPDDRRTQLQAFLKNAGMLGGLLMSALDTGGRPSVFWSGRRAAGRAAERVNTAAASVSDAVSSAVHLPASIMS